MSEIGGGPCDRGVVLKKGSGNQKLISGLTQHTIMGEMELEYGLKRSCVFNKRRVW